MTEEQKQAVYDCIRDYLWVARVWNDHNFTPEDIMKKANKAADALGCTDVDEANKFLDQLHAQLSA